MADEPYKKGSGADQLPQGEAKQLNEGVQEADRQAKQNEQNTGQPQQEEYQHQPVDFTGPPRDNSPSMPQGEDDQMLFGPTERPQEPITAGRAPVGHQPPPQDINSWLSTLQEAASDPGAPESIKNLFRLVVYHMNQGQ